MIIPRPGFGTESATLHRGNKNRQYLPRRERGYIAPPTKSLGIYIYEARIYEARIYNAQGLGTKEGGDTQYSGMHAYKARGGRGLRYRHKETELHVHCAGWEQEEGQRRGNCANRKRKSRKRSKKQQYGSV